MDRISLNPHITEIHCPQNGFFPNNEFPVLLYHEALTLPRSKEKATQYIVKLLADHGWKNAWVNGIYDFHHFHSNTHECLVMLSGNARVILGGPNGKPADLQKGDLLVIPAGVGHRAVSCSSDFSCVGAYPVSKDYDICRGAEEEFDKAKKRIEAVGLPRQDPLLGKEGLLHSLWR